MTNSETYYGIDKWRTVINLISLALISLICGVLILKYRRDYTYLGYIFLILTFIFMFNGIRMINYMTWGKFKHRDRMLDLAQWKGAEKVLDVGVGKGLILIKVAKKLTTGKVTGIDIWSNEDMLDKSKYYINKNIEIEGVKDKVRIKTQNAAAMSFNDEYFDIVLSNLCIHNIEDKVERMKAIDEMARVVKKGGKIIISDSKYMDEYEQILLDKEFKVNVLNGCVWSTYPALKIIEAIKQ